MADPRSTSTHRIGTEPKRTITFKIDGADIVYDATQPFGSAVVGRAVRQSGNGIVRLVGAGEQVEGKLILVEKDGYCAVQTEGVVDLPKGDGAVAVGDKIVGDVRGAVRGYIRGAPAAAGAYAQANIDEIGRGRHRVLDVAVADAIEVELGT